MDKIKRGNSFLVDIKHLKKVKLTKIKDNRFQGKHPNGINTGHVREGYLLQEPKVGVSCVIDNFMTSEVTAILDDDTFETLNSTYKIEYL